MGNSATSQTLKPPPTIKSKLSLGDKSSNSVSTAGIARKHLDLNTTSVRSSSNSVPKTPIPREYKFQFQDTNNNIKAKKRFRLFNKKQPQKIEESVKKRNGITGICLSRKIAQNLYIFWKSHIDTLSPKLQLEIGALIYFEMLEYCDDDFKVIFKHQKIAHTSLKFVEKIRWLINALNNDEIDLHIILNKLGKLHKINMVKLQYFEAFLSALHIVLSEYFPNKYKIEVKYCLDKTFVICTKIMIGKSPNYTTRRKSISLTNQVKIKIDAETKIEPSSSFIGVDGLIDWYDSRSIKTSEIWLKNLDSCLKSEIGKEYFFRFLEQTSCYELVIFLILYWEFKRGMSEKEKFMVSRKIVNTCIDMDDTSPFPINISWETKMNFIHRMNGIEDIWRMQLQRRSVLLTDTRSVQYDDIDSFTVPPDLLDEMLFEIKRLIQQNHWRRFCLQIESMANTTSVSLEIL